MQQYYYQSKGWLQQALIQIQSKLQNEAHSHFLQAKLPSAPLHAPDVSAVFHQADIHAGKEAQILQQPAACASLRN
ncbi:hypothetical protein FGO68_gene17004 [Halteria grandinella]|uniref:Uncharacterized protein n=1 Tax=Halteria grandinella TaxID=5974 RepID=A0A8J8NF46_HALGN|nr:hypothetical protein FGO68_gene17004 [Halteria grandinella]